MSDDERAGEWWGINPDGTPDEAMLAEITRAIVNAVHPQRVILFGSGARGRMNAKSDLDLLVVKDDEHYREVAWKIYTSMPAGMRKVDLVVATNDDLERHRDKPYYVIKPALQEGRVLYDDATHS